MRATGRRELYTLVLTIMEAVSPRDAGRTVGAFPARPTEIRICYAQVSIGGQKQLVGSGR